MRRPALAAAVALSLSFAACSNGGSQSQTGKTTPSAGAQASASVSGATVSSSLAVVDAAQAGAKTVTFTAKPQNVTASVPRFAQARNLSMAVEVVRGRMLRAAWRANATSEAVTSQVIASSDAVLGVALHSDSTIGGKDTSQDATVWYSTAKKQSYSSSALVASGQWPAFVQALTEATKASGHDTAKLATLLTSGAAPYGQAPALGFSGNGDLVALFSSGTLATDPVTVSIAADKAKPLLSVFGKQALAASTSSAKFTGTTTQPVDPELAKGVVGKRPSTAVGPDCRVLHCAAITYDDGPSAMTPQLLQTIKKSRVSITFFEMGNSINAYPAIAQQVAAAGMEIGNHTVTHPDLPEKTPERITKELTDNSDLLAKVLGAPPLLFRPPYGAHNSTVDSVAKDLGMAVIQWEVDTEDWKTHSVEKTTQTAETARNYTATIVLEHDIQKASIEAAPAIYSALLAKGLTLVSVSELSLNSGGYLAGHAYCRGTSEKQEGFNCKG